ncbi:SGNH/GDSL hydrolase family protein [Arthrobacter sp. efr-133-TYG-118]|uniref:SGNH/GDSL hydrolase family protein n=1 Tax=Arthrobacter sp. efr-133-TYG-118 TaxID=3040279 RepID=UPI00254A6C04|nr:SGNH/GDSL hydrolase family protein [Arthrobacter sp. efr-133-TYG-118]
MQAANSRRRYGRLVGAVAAVVLLAGFGSGPAQANPVTTKPADVYVALGDSYAAGTGGSTPAPASLPGCHQSLDSYAALLGGLNLGCFGATSLAVKAGLDKLSPNDPVAMALGSATEVSVTVGGNDVGTGAVAVACTSADALACASAVQNVANALPALPANIVAMVQSIRQKAPHAEIVLTGYPRLFTIGPMMPSSQKQLATTLNGMADQLNATISGAASAAGVGYVSVTERFTGHGIGSNNPWINYTQPSPLDPPELALENFHPNDAGYSQGYRTAVNSALKK